MRRLSIVFAFSLLCGFALACSSANIYLQGNNYSIEYFSGGGFTGLERGITIECNGILKKWERKLNSKMEILDSLKLDSSTMENISQLMNDSDVFSYKLKNAGNYTTTLKLSREQEVNIVSFNSADPPLDFPASIKAILLEVERINKHRVNQ